MEASRNPEIEVEAPAVWRARASAGAFFGWQIVDGRERVAGNHRNLPDSRNSARRPWLAIMPLQSMHRGVLKS